ncbi:2-phospho-L-lactate guanylyltransferase [Actinoplanes teichomyceticus]|uniref:Phosphoenolpyruvate guanylyltransferase n=1 Tax=Actinoplanes teichomyceticus TaxID=1867 RepID=A0A561WNK6_ACTTI|nr:2-phospho-L-lactate guanylyltransferase [Actinoplanes teichomyceticus]TWG25447.1 2-phospho-L-lactate guanylyltransferase [Actinoplanes teichomyceticus]GIF10515.1 2-phospho-L-lactate guanylyltransferase [Actinoplanes teichomyceticus]
MTVIPVKRLDAAKSRLRGAVPVERHPELALAMVCDTVAAVLAATTVAGLIVVTSDPVVAEAVRGLGAEVAPDPGAGLNAALRFGADEVAGPAAHRAVLTGDLPALRPEQLDAALRAVHGRGFVPDAAGTGTVLLAVPPAQPLDPRFGPHSAAAHRASGATALTGDWPGLRQDVDTAADLHAVLGLGAGERTGALLRDLGLSRACAPAGCAG